MKELFNMQSVLVIAIIGGAVWYIGRSFYKSTKGHACAQGNCKCADKKVKAGN